MSNISHSKYITFLTWIVQIKPQKDNIYETQIFKMDFIKRFIIKKNPDYSPVFVQSLEFTRTYKKQKF